MTHKPSNVAAAVHIIGVYVIGITCFDECFFILSNNWKATFFIKIYRYAEDFSGRHADVFFAEVFRKRSIFYIIFAKTLQY